MTATIDLNSDLGESFGHYTLGMDESVIPLVSSVNIACGFHAGDPSVMRKTVALAKDAGIHLGAHPGYPDLQGFGRRPMTILPEEAYDNVVYQVGALMAVCKTQGVALSHVKPHGAFYNRCAVDAALAEAVACAVRDLDSSLILVALANGELAWAGRKAGLTVAQEYFVDRNYDDEGHLADRTSPGAMIHDDDIAVNRAVQVIQTGKIESISGKVIEIQADTICVHGDGPEALLFVKRLRETFAEAGIQVAPVTR